MLLLFFFFFCVDFLIFRDMGYDGIVLEAWSRWAAYGILHDPEMRNLVHFKLSAPYVIIFL